MNFNSDNLNNNNFNMSQNKIQEFLNEKFGSCRFVNINNKIYFFAIDVAKILLYRDTNKMLKNIEITNTPSGGVRSIDKNGDEQIRYYQLIDESIFYRVVIKADKQNPKRYAIVLEFIDWITGIVLPNIRKNDMYISNEENCKNIDEFKTLADETINKRIENYESTINKLNDELIEDKIIIEEKDVEIFNKNIKIDNLYDQAVPKLYKEHHRIIIYIDEIVGNKVKIYFKRVANRSLSKADKLKIFDEDNKKEIIYDNDSLPISITPIIDIKEIIKKTFDENDYELKYNNLTLNANLLDRFKSIVNNYMDTKFRNK